MSDAPRSDPQPELIQVDTGSAPGRLRPLSVPQDDKPVSIIPLQTLAYYQGQNPDFTLDLVPDGVRRVLDVGCGRGWLGRKLKERGVEEVVGIEHFQPAADEAREALDTVFTGDIEQVCLDYPAGYFDCVVYSGVLEHIRDPWFQLYRDRSILADDGCVVALLPNVQHYSVVFDLLQGKWTYTAAGQLDATHYRFFTRAEILKMFRETGFRVSPLRGIKLWDSPPEVERFVALLRQSGFASAEFLQDLEVYIWTARAWKLPQWQAAERRAPENPHLLPSALSAGASAEPAPPPAPPAASAATSRAGAATDDAADVPETSIVIVSYNSKAELEQCLASVAQGSRTTYEVIVVDNASTDGTAEWLEGRADIRLIRNAENRGYSVAANQGIRAARGAYCILLNPDTIVTTGWDAKLVAQARRPDVGAAGPLAQPACCGWQRLEMWLKEPLRGEQSLKAVADKVAAWYPGQAHQVKLLTGFCLCVPTAVFDEVGLLDEDLFIGNDDVDLSLRLQWAGYKLVVALDAFILHHGMKSFTGMPDAVRARYIQESTDALYAKLERKFGAGKVPPWPELIGLPWHLPSHLREHVFTGERANPHSPNMPADVMAEHWARYAFARRYAAGKRMLDAACGTGYGSAHLAEAAAAVVACDVDRESLAYARATHGRENLSFVRGDVRRLPLADGQFDCITSFETIEHVAEGRALLAEFARLLRPDGVLLVSTPLGSEDGNPYHLAHYNRADFGPMLEEFFGDVEMRYQREESFSETSSLPMVAPRFAGEYALAICRAPKGAGVAEPARRANGGHAAAEVPMTAVRSSNGHSNGHADATPVVSVIIPAWNQLAMTKGCIDSVAAFTSEPHEIIVVDNGSDDGTGEWLAEQAHVRTISNERNLGFAAACNQGLAAARGRYLVLLNNDTIVTPGWSTRLIAAVEQNASAGLVGPRSNRVAGPQQDETATYKSGEALLEHAARLAKAMEGEHEDVSWLSGFCWLLPRDAYEAVGPLDERFGVGTFEDNDYCKRLAMAGRRLLIAHDAFVHHHCSATFTAAGIDYAEQMAANQKVFIAKWADDPIARAITVFEAGDRRAAVELCRRATEETPAYAEAWRNLAVLLVHAHRWNEAIRPLEKMAELRPHYWIGRVQLAKAYCKVGRYVDASREAQLLCNRQRLGPASRAEALVIAGKVAVVANEWAAAERAFRAALASQAECAGAWNGLGLVAHHAGAVDEAREAFTRAGTLDELDADSMSNLGVLAWDAGEAAQALDRFKSALDRDPLHGDALDNFVAVARAVGRTDEARERVETVLRLDPTREDARQLLEQCTAA